MKRSTSRLLSTLLVLCMVLALLPGTAWAGGDTRSKIRIVYDKDYKNTVEIFIAEQTTPLSGEGWSYEPASKTLILDGFKGHHIGFEGADYVYNYTLELRGTNSISNGLNLGFKKGSTATITGSGSVDVNTFSGSINIFMKSGTITTSGKDYSYYGVYFANDCTFHMSGGTLNAIGERYGIYSPSSEACKIILEGGTVTAHGDYAAIWLEGAEVNKHKANILDLCGRTTVGGNKESDRQVLFLKTVEKEFPSTENPNGTIQNNNYYITALASGELTPGTNTGSNWRKYVGGAAKYAYISDAGQSTTPSTPAPSGPKVQLSPQKLSVDGKNIDCEKYNIDGNNYFKLRDLAKLLSGTGSQFEVGYDNASKTISITKGKVYTPNGSELVLRGDLSAKAVASPQTLRINGVKHDNLKAYNIGGNNFFQLRELGDLLDFAVTYDEATKTAVVRSK